MANQTLNRNRGDSYIIMCAIVIACYLIVKTIIYVLEVSGKR